MPELSILSGGAAHGLVTALSTRFKAETGFDIRGDFGAVGGMRKRIMDGEQPDLVILTAAILKDLAAAGIVDPATVADIGAAPTSVAVRDGDAPPPLGDADDLRRALMAADAIYFPDPALATAGIHFRSVMEKLGVLAEVEARLRIFPNGATAMKALAGAPEARPIGSTQATEIVATPGVRLVGDLPPPHGLSTVYTAGVVNGAAAAEAALSLVRMLAGPEAADLRRTCAFA